MSGTDFEIQVKVSANGQPDAFIHREYRSHEKASTAGVAEEIWEGVAEATKAKMRPVNDGD